MNNTEEEHLVRCPWPGDDPAMIHYHDTEWGVPNHHDRRWFEYITLDAFQAGLSWQIILNKRDGFRRAFAGFDPEKVARFDQQQVEELRKNPEIVRNKLKIESTVTNARAFLDVQSEFGSFDAYIWKFVNHKPIINSWESLENIPATSEESDTMSADLKKRGFKFVGSTICYAFMQAGGLVNDHLVSCFRYRWIIDRFDEVQPEDIPPVIKN